MKYNFESLKCFHYHASPGTRHLGDVLISTTWRRFTDKSKHEYKYPIFKSSNYKTLSIRAVL